MSKGELASSYFLKGYNCSQAIILAFKDYIKVPTSDLIKLTYPLGGGIARLREACGAFTASTLVIGYLFNDDTINQTKKTELYKLVQEFANLFKKENHFINCRQLLNLSNDEKICSTPSTRDEHFYKSRPCLKIISSAANLLEQFLIDKKLI